MNFIIIILYLLLIIFISKKRIFESILLIIFILYFRLNIETYQESRIYKFVKFLKDLSDLNKQNEIPLLLNDINKLEKDFDLDKSTLNIIIKDTILKDEKVFNEFEKIRDIKKPTKTPANFYKPIFLVTKKPAVINTVNKDVTINLSNVIYNEKTYTMTNFLNIIYNLPSKIDGNLIINNPNSLLDQKKFNFIVSFLEEITGKLEIKNTTYENLNGFKRLKKVKSIILENNFNLVSICGLKNIYNDDFTMIRIKNNNIKFISENLYINKPNFIYLNRFGDFPSLSSNLCSNLSYNNTHICRAKIIEYNSLKISNINDNTEFNQLYVHYDESSNFDNKNITIPNIQELVSEDGINYIGKEYDNKILNIKQINEKIHVNLQIKLSNQDPVVVYRFVCKDETSFWIDNENRIINIKLEVLNINPVTTNVPTIVNSMEMPNEPTTTNIPDVPATQQSHITTQTPTL